MLAFQPTVTIADIINGILLILALIGIFLTFKQIRHNDKTQKAAFFKVLYSTIFTDPDKRKAFYLIEYGKFTYDESFHCSLNEQAFDRMFGFNDLVCDLYFQGVLTKREMAYFRYGFTRIYQDKEVVKYLDFLKSFFVETGIAARPFPSYIAYCEEVLKLGPSA